ncbi:patatin-like phospholipase family protein [Arsenicicoccus sp. oral taxon 190]|uniref:patatin-like phospholipase family protein n=1 Tax=Arsenicicoccus sp. oral taxon 190 TaxID=1658671 RepID=UPI00067A3E3C|nr:patatin family protein [Arsenicicoccus sp. oral taxon 190]AKT51356.1 phospholipase [Arsenicicoccus sp. oral taxon 190]
MGDVSALTSTVTDTALVFEGGGMRGSYTAAVVTTLLQAGIHLDYVAGISAGSSHTCNYLSRDAARAKRSFVDFAADPRFGDLRTFLRGQGMFNAQYIYEETSLPDQALPFDWETFTANPARLRIGAVRCDTGEHVYWGREDMPQLRDLTVRVRASSTMPVVMPITTIDDVRYVDGALGPSGGIPLDVAQQDGYDRFLVVLTRERDYVKRPERRPAFYRRYFRRYPAVADAILQRWRRYNETREQLWELERQGRAMVFVPDRMPVSNGERRVARLQQSYDLGLAQARRELPRWREFLGVPA